MINALPAKPRGHRPSTAEMASMLAFLADDTRRTLLVVLGQRGSATSAELSAALGAKKSTVDYHLRRLRDRKLVIIEEGGSVRIYRLSERVRLSASKGRRYLSIVLGDGSRISVSLPSHGSS